MFFTNLFESNLVSKKLFQDIIYYTTTDSTNDDVWEEYQETKNNILIITDNQKNGRGRNNNTWFSKPSHSITCSFILEQVFKNEKINLHSLLIPIAIIEGIKEFTSIQLQVKWPNDLMYENKKVGGILIESKSHNMSYVYNVGIGVNVNEDLDDFPDSIKNNSISLKQISGHPIQREPLLASIFNRLNTLIQNLDSIELTDLWMAYCMHKNLQVKFQYQNNTITGIFKGLNNNGQAIIDCNNETITYNGAINLLV